MKIPEPSKKILSLVINPGNPVGFSARKWRLNIRIYYTSHHLVINIILKGLGI